MNTEKFKELLKTVSPEKINELFHDVTSNPDEDDLPKKIEFLESKYRVIRKELLTIENKRLHLLGNLHLSLLRAAVIGFKENCLVLKSWPKEGLTTRNYFPTERISENIRVCMQAIDEFELRLKLSESANKSKSGYNGGKKDKKKPWVIELVQWLKAKYPGESARYCWNNFKNDSTDTLSLSDFEVYKDGDAICLEGSDQSIRIDAFRKYFNPPKK